MVIRSSIEDTYRMYTFLAKWNSDFCNKVTVENHLLNNLYVDYEFLDKLLYQDIGKELPILNREYYSMLCSFK